MQIPIGAAPAPTTEPPRTRPRRPYAEPVRDPLAMAFLLLVALFIPYLALRSHLSLVRGNPMPPTRRAHRSTLVFLGLLTALAAWVAHRADIVLFPPVHVDPGLAGAAGAGVVVMLIIGAVRWRFRSPDSRRRLEALLPRGPADWLTWIMLCLAAGVGEEIAYRAVFHTLLERWTGQWAVAATLGALAFGLAHAVQGLGAMVLTCAIGLALQVLVRASDNLYLAMAAHFTYDLAAGALYVFLARAAPPPPGPPSTGVRGL